MSVIFTKSGEERKCASPRLNSEKEERETQSSNARGEKSADGAAYLAKFQRYWELLMECTRSPLIMKNESIQTRKSR